MMIDRIKNITWVLIVIFSICSFIQLLLTLNPRVINLEERVAGCEYKVSAIEIKLDTLLAQSSETCKDVKDIYHLIMDRHK
ncbi:MAG: hypothetical protein IJV97_03145 [Alphaproteobacteria bacterium]|nr:hypothetical protein [Alphaproteobacteria bacterium]